MEKNDLLERLSTLRDTYVQRAEETTQAIRLLSGSVPAEPPQKITPVPMVKEFRTFKEAAQAKEESPLMALIRGVLDKAGKPLTRQQVFERIAAAGWSGKPIAVVATLRNKHTFRQIGKDTFALRQRAFAHRNSASNVAADKRQGRTKKK